MSDQIDELIREAVKNKRVSLFDDTALRERDYPLVQVIVRGLPGYAPGEKFAVTMAYNEGMTDDEICHIVRREFDAFETD